MKRILQPKVIKVIQKEISEYICDYCGKVCGTKENRKETLFVCPSHKKSYEEHYCKKTKCSQKRFDEAVDTLIASESLNSDS